MDAVKSKGIKFGIRETTTILNELNIQAMKIAIRIMTKKSEVKRFRTKYLVPFKNNILAPVMVTLYFSESNILSIFGCKISIMLSSFGVVISDIRILIRAT